MRSENLELENPKDVGSFVSVGGAKVFYRSAGSGSPIILLHGWPMSSYDWRQFLAPLSKFGRVIAPDMFGFGHSEAPIDHNPWRFVSEFIEAMSLDRFTIGGYDRGGSLSLEYAIQNPGRVSRLIVMNAATYPDWVDHARNSVAYAQIRRITRSSLARGIALNFLINRRRLQQIMAPTSGIAISEDVLNQQLFFLKHGFRNLARMRPVPYAEPFLVESRRQRQVWAVRVKELQMPTLIIFGKDDPLSPPGTAERLHQDIAGSRLHVLEHTGHFLTEERPQGVIDLVGTFLSGTASSAQGTHSLKARES
jgi:pimeloyl-ACP methyl ester carboxylesterase